MIRQAGCLVAAVTARAGVAVTSAAVAGAGRHFEGWCGWLATLEVVAWLVGFGG
ncbi:hypothetical protein BJX68DRAFT_248808 [Aspergillus pseudodeflectus]|uniref:Uncharacterized protein n=1 Tax=Aspergillus pseudodeflectus TaxID=176178 RepID=A0ABR4JHM6_9EURO